MRTTISSSETPRLSRGSRGTTGLKTWTSICLPDGDDDVLTDGCVRFASIRDTSAEPTGFIFTGSGESACVNIQHRAVNDGLGNTNHGALVKISGFKVKSRGHGPDDDDDWDWKK
jgi:hypothetical protein